MIIQNYIEKIAKCSKPAEGVTRLPFTKEHKSANNLLKQWMSDAGLKISLDAAGTLIGKYVSPKKNAKTLLIGSHQDSGYNSGRYDGIMGVILPILALKELKKKKIILPYNVEILAFADEEGVRFPTALMGPRSLAGTFNKKDLKLKDKNNISIEQALKSFGCNPSKINSLKRNKKDLLGFFEVHIEQGPVLESKNLAVGIVNGISGISRFKLEIEGYASHAGTTPMHLRKDSLAATAEVINAVENLAKKNKNFLATMASIENKPNSVNAIPAKSLSFVECRSVDDKKRKKVEKEISKKIGIICKKRGLKFILNKTYDQSAVSCDKKMMSKLKKSFQNLKLNPFVLMSGATHDASAMSDLCPISMLFVRSQKGLSHNPKEFTIEKDMQIAVKVIEKFLINFN